MKSLVQDNGNCLKESTGEKLRACSDRAANANSIDFSVAMKCVNESFESASDLTTDNSLLKKYRDLAVHRGVYYTPYIQINGKEYLVRPFDLTKGRKSRWWRCHGITL